MTIAATLCLFGVIGFWTSWGLDVMLIADVTLILLIWLDATLADTLSTLASTADGDHYFFELALYHEDMHAETLLMTLQSLALPLPPRYASMPRVGTSHATMATGRGTMATSHAAIATDVHFEGGCFDMGADTAAATGRFSKGRCWGWFSRSRPCGRAFPLTWPCAS